MLSSVLSPIVNQAAEDTFGDVVTYGSSGPKLDSCHSLWQHLTTRDFDGAWRLGAML